MEKDKKALLIKLGKNIKAVRKTKNLTQRELALEMGKDTQAIERLERGGTNPTYYFLHQVSIALEVPIAELVTINGV